MATVAHRTSIDEGNIGDNGSTDNGEPSATGHTMNDAMKNGTIAIEGIGSRKYTPQTVEIRPLFTSRHFAWPPITGMEEETQRLANSLRCSKMLSPDLLDSRGTLAPFIRGAWALLLGRIMNTNDVAFEETSVTCPVLTGADKMRDTRQFRVQLNPNRTLFEYVQSFQGDAGDTMLPQNKEPDSNLKSNDDQWHALSSLVHFGVQHQSRDVDQQDLTSNYDFVLQVHLCGGKLHISISSRLPTVESWAFNSILEHLYHATGQMYQFSPDQLLGTINLATPKELNQIWEWNSHVPKPIDKSVEEMITKHVQVQPDSPAICAWDGQLTYSKLDRLASQLASRLFGLGVRPDVLVPLIFEKSMWTAVAILGVVKAGGGFILLDPALPKARLQAIMQEIQCRLILTSESAQHTLPQIDQATVTVNWPLFTNSSQETNFSKFEAPHPSSVLYAVFTSGSTGTPKGVMITYQNMSSTLYYQKDILGLTEKSRVFDFAAYSFDISIHSYFATLAAGGCLCVPNGKDRIDGLEQSIISLQANYLDLTPSVARILCPSKIPAVKSITYCGEAVRISDAEQWWGTAKVRNAYGPCECTPMSTFNCEASCPGEAVHIGKGVGVVTWIVNQENHNELAPPGCVGELLLEGPSVGLGYMNDSEKTNASFIVDPPWLTKGATNWPGRHGRLYKTGDLVKYAQDGNLIFQGRKDFQVKIRGQRTELGEIENVLCNHDRVDSAAVLFESSEGQKASLTAFVTLRSWPDHTDKLRSPEDVPETSTYDVPKSQQLENDSWEKVEQELYEALQSKLPVYMVPCSISLLDEIPLTKNGKVNRRALANKTNSCMKECSPIQLPRSDLESRLQATWAKALGVLPANIGVHTNFFQLGGNSISAIKVIAEARRVGLKLSLAEILQHPTIAELTAYVTDFGKKMSEYTPGSSDLLIDCTLKKSILAEIDTMNLDHVRSDLIANILPVTWLQGDCLNDGLNYPRQFCEYYYFDLGIDVDIKRLETSCSRVLEELPILRACFPRVSGRFWQVVLEKLSCPLRIHNANDTLDQSLHDVCSHDIETVVPSHPTVRFFLIRHKIEGFRFIVRLSHPQFDGFCLPKIFQAIFNSYSDKQISPVLDFSELLAHSNHVRAESIKYWAGVLQDSSMTHTRPCFVPESVQASSVRSICIHEEVQIPHLPSTLLTSSLVSAAWAVVLSQMTREREVVYANLVTGRNSSLEGIEDLIGACISSIPIRVNLIELVTPRDLVSCVQQQLVGLGEADTLGFRDIVDNCTNWPEGSEFDAEIQHQSMEMDTEIHFKEIKGRVQAYQNPYFITPRLSITSFQKGSRLTIALTANTHIMTTETANKLLHALCRVILGLGNCLEKSLEAVIKEVDCEI